MRQHPVTQIQHIQQHKKGGTRVSAKDAASSKTATRKARFLEAFMRDATVFHAARAASIDRGTHYAWLKNDPEYARAFSDAEEEAVQNLEAEARRRAVEGVDKPVFYRGQAIGKIRDYSDLLLIFLLKAKRPELYRDRFDHSPRDGNTKQPPPVNNVDARTGS